MHARTWTARALALLLGTLALVLTAEAALQLAAALRPDHRTTSDAPARYTILCEGDSFTYGIGGISFPEQLEELLNERVGRRAFRVVNKGVPGLNTAMLADELEGHLRETRPDVVIVLAGENNSWNAVRLEQGAPWHERLRYAVQRTRVYK
ncbi:MAG: hypothetical protein KC656_32420, partial [Myxococcales bacterium]|nr:hypothetical protein [Myxococcales bacterium]